MSKLWIYALLLSIIVTACSDDTPNAPEENSDSSSIEIIEIIPDDKSSSSITRPPKNVIYFSYTVEEKSSSSEAISSSSEKSSSSSQPKSSAASSSSEASSSSVQSSSSNIPKSSAALLFYNCKEHDCVYTEYLNPDISYGELLDKRDNQVYRTIVISNNVWTAQNMNYQTESAEDGSEESWCYNDDSDNCKKFGRLYNWEAALKACPEGWHLPTADDWKELLEDHSCSKDTEHEEISYLCTGAKLKATDSWDETNELDNALGFSVTAAGIIYNGNATSLGEATFFWSSSDTLSRYPYAVLFSVDENSATIGVTEKENGFSVRCLKGNAVSAE